MAAWCGGRRRRRQRWFVALWWRRRTGLVGPGGPWQRLRVAGCVWRSGAGCAEARRLLEARGGAGVDGGASCWAGWWMVAWCGGGGGVWWWSSVAVLRGAGVSRRAGWPGGMGCRAGRTHSPASLSAGSGASSVNSALTAVGADSGGTRGCRLPPWRRCREAPFSPAWRSWARRAKAQASVFRSGQRRRFLVASSLEALPWPPVSTPAIGGRLSEVCCGAEDPSILSTPCPCRDHMLRAHLAWILPRAPAWMPSLTLPNMPMRLGRMVEMVLVGQIGRAHV